MKRVAGILLIASFILGLSVTSFGHTPIDRRQHRQRERIRQGVRSDELTRREARRLGVEQARIRRYEARARRDGGLSFRERRRLDRRLDRANRHILRQKHDRQDRDR
ncbi:MAG TPA: hypothetical protein VE262_21140 [Blastocatellia bacterium]|nr:hypothetical protein [Blastocatellia bacterium]